MSRNNRYNSMVDVTKPDLGINCRLPDIDSKADLSTNYRFPDIN